MLRILLGYLVIVAFTPAGKAQSIFKDLKAWDNRTSIVRGDTTYEFQTEDEDTEITPGLRYHYLQGGTIHSNIGGYSGKLIHGSFAKLSRAGKLLEKGTMMHGLKVGDWQSWHTNGNLKAQYRWTAGMKWGPFQEYNDRGQLVREGRFMNGLLDGPIKTYSENNAKPVVTRYKNGVVVGKKPKEATAKEKSLFRKKSKTNESGDEKKSKTKSGDKPTTVNPTQPSTLTPGTEPAPKKVKKSKSKKKKSETTIGPT